jgi:hypothetical protein
MYDLAMRSLALTVVTGGLLLTGTAYTPALAAAGVGVLQGQARAQGVQNDAGTSASTANAGLSGGTAQSAPEGRAAERPPPDPPSTDASHPRSSGGALSGNTIQIPADTGIDLCGDNVEAAALRDTAIGGACATWSDLEASSTTSHSGGVASGNDVQVPVDVPILACGSIVGGVLVEDAFGGTDCSGAPLYSTPGRLSGAGSVARTDHSGNIVQAPVNVPANACGNDVNAGMPQSAESDSDCENTAEGSAPTMPGAPAPGSGGASATAISVGNGGIGSGVTVRTPIEMPVNACGTELVAAGEHVDDRKPDCSSSNRGGDTPAGSTAIDVSSNGGGGITTVSIGRDSGGVGSGNDVPVPVKAPVNLRGADIDAVQGESGGADCSNGTAAPGGGMYGHLTPTCTPTDPSTPTGPGTPTGLGTSTTLPSWPTGPPPSGTTTPPPGGPSGPAHHRYGFGASADGQGGGGLAPTGTDIGVALGVAGAAVLGGLGLRARVRRREGE